MLLLCALAALSGCRSESLAVQEAQEVFARIDRLRAVDNADKAAALDALVRCPCSVPAVCEVKTRCSRAYQIHVEGLAQVTRAEALDDTPEKMREALDGATRHLAYAKTLAEQCAVYQGRLRERLGLTD